MKRYELKVDAGLNNIEPIMTFIEDKLKELKVERKCIVHTMLSAEEILAALIENKASDNSQVVVKVSSFCGQITINITCEGQSIDLDYVRNRTFNTELDEEANDVIRKLQDKIFGNHIVCSNKRGVNTCEIKVSVSSTRSLYITLLSIVLGLLGGFLLKVAAPQTVSQWISTNIFSSISTMFVNALKMIMGPLVFFSIASSVADFKNIKALGKIAIRVVGTYIVTSIVAIGIGYLVYNLFPVGNPALQGIVSSAADSYIETSQSMVVSIKDTIVNIVPTSIVGPFINGDMLQIVFVSVLFGVVVSLFSKKLSGAEKFLTEGNYLFGKFTEIVIKVLPLAIFSSMAKLVVSMNFANVAQVFVVIPVCYFGCIIMIIIYLLMLIIVGRLNPLQFIKKFGPVSLVAFGLGSSNSTMPYSMDACDKKLGISSKLYSFSIPLGATLNMDGTCISLMVVSLFLARIFGIEVTGGALLSLIISVLVLSMGAPGIPGVNLICTALLLPQLGVPVEALSLVMGIHTLIGMGNACVNVTGDAMVTTLVAKNQGMIDLKQYNSK